MSALPDAARARISLSGVVAAALGLILFIWALTQAGLPTIVEGIKRVGAAFILIVALAGMRFWLRARAWALATEGPPGLSARDTFPALVAGDAMGNLTPLGLFVSEALKAAFVRSRVTLMTAIAGIAIENIVYTFSVAMMIAAGTFALLFLFDMGEALRNIAAAALLAIGLLLGLASIILTRQLKVVAPTVDWLRRHNRGSSRLASRLERLQALEELIFGFAIRHPGQVASIFLLEFAFHVFGVVEIWITLALLAGGSTPTLLTAFVLESVNRTIMVVFKFVPLRLGVDEVGTELLTRTLGLPAGIGVTMAIVRKARMILWSAVGVAFLVRRGLRPATLVIESRE